MFIHLPVSLFTSVSSFFSPEFILYKCVTVMIEVHLSCTAVYIEAHELQIYLFIYFYFPAEIIYSIFFILTGVLQLL